MMDKLEDESKIRVRIITSCTGEKKVHPDNQLLLADFQAGTFFKPELESFALPGGEMYTGLQHQRLMDGIRQFRDSGREVKLSIVSAGYGLIDEGQSIQPYEATFTGMPKKALKEWGARLGLPKTLKAKLEESADLQLVLLGDTYLDACDLDSTLDLTAPTIFLCGAAAQKKLPKVKNAGQVVLANKDAKRFSCGLVGLKGEVAKRLLRHVADHPDQLGKLVALPPNELLDLIAGPVGPEKPKASRTPIANDRVDRVITLSQTWRNSPHKAKINYFIPEWDDLVDPDFDFETDTHSGGSGDWSNEVYAHQMYPAPNYDGILVSRAVAEKCKKKTARINSMGVHRFLRVPREFPIMGDCGAFDYIMEDVPPYSTEDVLDYYTRLDFDAGVSVDHLIVKATEHQRDFRYQLTIANAESFLTEHRRRGLDWTPIGAVQGWSPDSYAEAARQYVAMGYDYIGLGGLVRSTTEELIRIVTAVRALVKPDTRIHLFGIARPKAIHRFADLGVTSIDSASFLRRAWMGTGQNYLSPEGDFYAAIRIPEANKSFRSKRIVTDGRASANEVLAMEQRCLTTLRAFDKGAASIDATLNAILEYDRLITPGRPDNEDVLRRSLEDKPWKRCECAICQQDGIEVAIFRGNNRNRRRGFHNTYVFYKLFKEAALGQELPTTWVDEDEAISLQGSLFELVQT
jgi:hypothetical protein